MMEDVAWTFGWPPSELNKLHVSDLKRWHEAANRINRRVYG